MDVKEKIIQYIEENKISKYAFEKSIGVSKSYLSNTKSISAEVLVNVCRVYSDISAEWLLRDNGDMISNASGIVLEDNQNSINNMDVKTLLDVIKRQNAIIDNLEKEVTLLKEESRFKNESPAV